MQKRIIKALLSLLVGVLCWTLALACSDAQNHLWQSKVVRYRTAQPTTQSFSQLDSLRQIILQDSQAQVTAFAQSLGLKVERVDASASIQADALYIHGDASLCWDLSILCGETIRSQTNGCVLDSNVAMQLFGSIDIVGNYIRINDQDIPICGVMDIPNHMAAFGADTGRGLLLISSRYAPAATTVDGLDFMEYGVSNAELQEHARKWLSIAGMDSSGSFQDTTTSQSIMDWFLVLPAYLLLVFMLLDLLGQLRRHSRISRQIAKEGYLIWRVDGGSFVATIIKPFLSCMVFIALIAAVLCIPRPTFTPPSTLLPTRWSNFSFWPKLLGTVGNTIAQASLEGVLLPDMWRNNYHTFGMLLVLGSLAAFLATRRELHTKKQPQTLQWELLECLLLCVGLLLCTYIAATQGLSTKDRIYYLSFPIGYWLLMLCLRIPKQTRRLEYRHASREQNEKRFNYET